MNLLKETLEELEFNDKKPEDVLWVGSESFGWFTWEDFAEVADKEYNSGYGSQEVATDLLVVGENWWLERDEYDGAEQWLFKTPPQKPDNYKKPNHVIVHGDLVGWETLESLNNA
jgi:hypothetical protein